MPIFPRIFVFATAAFICSCEAEHKSGFSSSTAAYVSVTEQSSGTCSVTTGEHIYSMPGEEAAFANELKLTAAQTQYVAVVTMGSRTSACWTRTLELVHAAGFKFLTT